MSLESKRARRGRHAYSAGRNSAAELRAELEERLNEALEDCVELATELERRVAEHEQRLDKFETMIARWKGGFVVVVALGTFAGWVLSNLESLVKIVSKGGGS